MEQGTPTSAGYFITEGKTGQVEILTELGSRCGEGIKGFKSMTFQVKNPKS